MADIVPDNIREFDDTKSARRNIYDNTLEAMKRRFPIEDDNYKLELVDLQYEGKQDFSLAEQKKAILNNQNLRTNLVGTWRLTDKKTGNVVDERRSSVMQVPYWTDRGTIINNGSEYTVISQSRLRPGVYARKKSNGEFETQFNVKPGTGHAFHFGLNPETGIMTLQTGQGSVPLYQVLKGIGVEDKDIIKHWGAEVTANNAKKADPQAWNKLYRRWAGYKAIPNATELDKIQFVKDALATYEVDPEVVERTLGLRNVTSLTPNVLLRASQKLLNISRGDEQPDNRDNPRFSKFYGVEDYFKERIDKNAGRLTNTLFYKVKRNGNLKSIQSNALNPWVDTIINGSGLAMPGEEANPLSTLEQMSRISKFGLGGIGSKDAVTMEARDVQGDYLGFVDNVAGPECFTPGSYIMSKTGFIPIEDVTYNTELACLIDNRLEYHTPERVISEHYSGDIYTADTKFIRYKVTNNHRIWHKKDTLTYSFNTAEQVHKQDITLMTGGHAPYVSDKVITEFSLPHTDNNIPAIDIETWGAFLGYFLSTGSVSCYNIYIPKTCSEHINDLTSVLNKLPLTYTVHNNDFVLSNDKLALYLSQFTNERHIPDYMFDATVEGRKAFLNALHHSQPTNNCTYTTTSSRLAYDIERICFTLGLSANVYHKHSKTSTWVVRFNQKQEYTLSSNSLWLKCDYSIEPYNGIVYCVTVPGGLVYARYGDTGAHWTGNSEAIGVDVRASYKTFLGKDNKLYGEFINRTTGKIEYVDIATAADRLVAFPGQDLSKPYVMAIKDGIPQKVPSSEVKYAVPSYAHMVASNTNMNPMPTTVQAGRQFYGSKFWSQYLPQAKGEVPLVDTLMPDGKLTWREYYGRKVGTLKSEVDGVVTKVEDNMVTVKDSEGKLHKTELVKSLPFNRMSLTGDTKVFVRRSGVPLCIRIDQYEFKPGDEVQSYDPTTCRSAWMPVTGFTRHENGVRLYRVLFESGRHVDCTENHSLLTMADDFTLKPEYPKDCVLNQTKCPVVFASADNESEWTFDQGLLDGLYISEGCTRKQSSAGIKKNRSINKDGSFRKVRSDLKYEEPTHTMCQIAVDPMDRRIFVKNLVERLGGKVHPSCMKERTIHGHGCTVVWTDPSLASRWHDDFGMYADKKHIAGHVFSRGREYLHGLLAGYLAGDGCLGSDTFGAVQVEFGTVSEELQNDLVSLCNILGIFAMPRKAKFNGVGYNDIYLSRISTASLYSVKPLFGYPDRQAKLESILPFRKTRATAFDNLPVETVDAKKTIYKSYPGKVPHFIYKSISSSKKVAKHRISGCSGRVGLWANSDILWDTIVSIEEIPHQQYVYDFSVEGSEAFATANGTLVHNTAVSYFPSVEVGQSIKAGDMLAHSNFTDKKTGSINMGQNLHVAILPTGNSFEDAYEISEEAAKKMATDRLYSFDQDTKNGVTINRNKYISAYPSKFTKEQIETLEDSGIVKVGTVLHRGDPIVLSLGPKILSSADKTLGKLSKALRDSYTDRSQTWEHDYEGVVVDSVVTPKGVKVNVQAKPPVRVGDKLCYDPETEVLTSAGWKPISDVTLNDNVATLNPETLHFEYLRPAAVRAYEHRGKMYRLESQQVDVLVTPNHNMFVQPRNKTGFGFYRAESIFGKRVSYKKDGLWVGEDPEVFTLPAMLVGHRWGTVLKPEIHLRMETFLMLLGMFLSEGSCVEHKASATYGIDISQVKPDFVEEARAAFAAAGIDVTYTDRHFRIHGAQYLAYFRQFGHAPDKFIPDFVFGLSSRLQRILLKWLMWGDGHSKAGRYICYTTTSRRLADDVQRLCLHCGYAANVKYDRCKAGSNGGWCVDHEVTRRHDIHDVQIITDKLTPAVNHGHVRGQKAQTEEYVDYDGMVYCCTMPKWHAIYVRRNGKSYWCGNSPAFGLKGVVGKIVPQDQMPRNAVTNQPYDILMNTMGFLSRVAPGQLMEISLGKVAKQTGKQIRIPQLPPPEGWYNWTQKQLKDAGVSETSDVFDPVTGKTMKGIGDGYMYTMAFHHLAEKKASAVGNDAAFTQDEQPAKGGFSGGKKMCFVSHQAIKTLHGEEHIGYIVEKRVRELVWTRFEDGSWGYAPVTNWFVRKGKMSDILSIQINYLPQENHGSLKSVTYGRKNICVTKNHEIYTPSGKTCAGALKPGDFVATYGYVPTNDQISLLYGSMLGDATICGIDQVSPYYLDQHSDKQSNYVWWKIRQLGTLVGSRKISGKKSKCGFKGGSGRTAFYTVNRPDITIPLRDTFYRGPDGFVKKTIKNVDLNSLTDVALVAWFIDDGCTSIRERGGLSGNISTMGFSEDDVDTLAAWLSSRLGVECHRGKYNDIRMGTAACEAMAKIVARYMTPDDIPSTKKWLISKVKEYSSLFTGVDTAYTLGTIGALVASVKPYSDGLHGPDDEINLYDITVDGSHKYCASDVLVSNSTMDLWALLAHNAPDVIKDSQLIRGTKNDQYWRALQLGLPTPEPEEPFIYKKFLNTLRAGGVNVTEKGSITSIMPQTDKDVEQLSQGRVITSSDMVDSDFEPVKGGLFDLGKTGGMSGNQWSMIQLPEPVPNPIMEEPVRRLLGLTVDKMENILAGRDKLNGKTGGTALKEALSSIDVDKQINESRRNISTLRGQKRDDAVKIYRYLTAMKKQGLKPSDWMISKVPVLPPTFRPVSKMGDVALVSDMNELYKDIIENSKNFEDLRKEVDDSALADERLNIYNSVKAAYGLGESISPENAAKGIKGAIKQVVGNRPKCYDSKTEVLTRRGWIPFGDVTLDDTIATVNQSTLKLEWQHPSDVIHTDYNGLMVHTLSSKIDLLVTPNHMHFVQKRAHGRVDGHKDERGRSVFLEWHKAEAASLLYDGARMHMLTAPSGYDGNGEPDFPGVKDKSAFAFICGMYVAEGWDTEYAANICQTSANPDICRMIRDAFDRSGVEYSETTFKKPHGRLSTYWSICSKEAVAWFRMHFGHLAGGKMISDTVLEWRSEYLRQLLDGYLYGDGEKAHGRKDPDTNKTFYSKDRMTCEHSRASTTSKQLVDDIAELCMKIGLGFRLCDIIEYDNQKWNTQYRFRVDGWNKVVIEGPKYHKWEMYSGQVHCVTVPNGLVVVRRNGLTAVSGNSGMFQSKVLSKAVDGVARGVISPDMNLDMDQCGIPETMAWPMYKPYVMRELIRNGYPSVQAVKMIADRTDTARSVLRKVMSQRPVILDRAPTWHKFNIMAFKPFLTEGDTIRVSPLIVSGFNADFDGDQMNAHVPSSDKAVQQALNKMLPSKNLTSLTDLSSPRHTPSKEQIFGLYALTKGMDATKQVKVFNSVSEAKQAYARGEIGPNDPIEIR